MAGIAVLDAKVVASLVEDLVSTYNNMLINAGIMDEATAQDAQDEFLADYQPKRATKPMAANPCKWIFQGGKNPGSQCPEPADPELLGYCKKCAKKKGPSQELERAGIEVPKSTRAARSNGTAIARAALGTSQPQALRTSPVAGFDVFGVDDLILLGENQSYMVKGSPCVCVIKTNVTYLLIGCALFDEPAGQWIIEKPSTDIVNTFSSAGIKTPKRMLSTAMEKRVLDDLSSAPEDVLQLMDEHQSETLTFQFNNPPTQVNTQRQQSQPMAQRPTLSQSRQPEGRRFQSTALTRPTVSGADSRPSRLSSGMFGNRSGLPSRTTGRAEEQASTDSAPPRTVINRSNVRGAQESGGPVTSRIGIRAGVRSSPEQQQQQESGGSLPSRAGMFNRNGDSGTTSSRLSSTRQSASIFGNRARQPAPQQKEEEVQTEQQVVEDEQSAKDLVNEELNSTEETLFEFTNDGEQEENGEETL